MSAQYSRRAAVPGPTSVKVLSDKSVTLAEAESLLTSYIDYSESSSVLDAAADAVMNAEQSNPASTAIDSIASAIARNENILGQLKRVQRNMRGLPPLRSQQTRESQQQPETEDVEMTQDAVEEPQTGEKRKISAEERKRLKKERRKLEKRDKSLAAAAAKADDEDDDDKDSEKSDSDLE